MISIFLRAVVVAFFVIVIVIIIVVTPIHQVRPYIRNMTASTISDHAKKFLVKTLKQRSGKSRKIVSSRANVKCYASK